MHLPINKSSLERFLKPISRLTDSCVLRLEGNKMFTLCSSQDQTIILYANSNLESDYNFKAKKINIISISKFLTGLECLGDSGEFSITLNPNHLFCQMKEIDDTKTHFKYHLVDDKVVSEAPVNLNKITSLNFDTTFDISQTSIRKIISAYTFTSNPNSKIYINTLENKIYATIDDKTQCNIDNVNLCMSSTFEGKEIEEDIILNMEIFKMISQSKSDIKIKINNQYKILTFTNTEDKNTTLKYIISALVK